MKHMLIITYAIVMDKRNITSWASGYQTLVHQNSSVGLWRPALIPRVSDSMGLEWGWECISDKFPGAADAAVWGPHSETMVLDMHLSLRIAQGVMLIHCNEYILLILNAGQMSKSDFSTCLWTSLALWPSESFRVPFPCDGRDGHFQDKSFQL